MWMKWLPWRFIARRAAQSHGFLDPIAVMMRLRRFSQPSEVTEPIELLRAGMVLHARGLLNSRVIQHNLDWVWPFWIERQFDPHDDAFVPRSFSITHINLTHRNWTAVGWPDYPNLPIVDPRGLVTPHHDGWSVDAWLITDAGGHLLPSRTPQSVQSAALDVGAAVHTRTDSDIGTLDVRADVAPLNGKMTCAVEIHGHAASPGWLVVSMRPYNPEGISLVHRVALSSDRQTWSVEGHPAVNFSSPVDRHHVSDYHNGDVYIHLRDREEQASGVCDLGMATAAALFRLGDGNRRGLVLQIPLPHERAPTDGAGWRSTLRNGCRLSITDKRVQRLYDTALRTLVLHSPDDVYPGPYTYKRFWFRDSAFIIHALLAAGFLDRAERALDRFGDRQRANGYFHSQEGEWDSNGQALWIFHRFCQLSGRTPKPSWRRQIINGARWIHRKRLPADGDAPHRGLLPAGFSAEHLGPNDYYYWDDFWGVAGLRAAADLLERFGDHAEAEQLRSQASDFAGAIDASLARDATRLGTQAVPASPYRRLDAGAIGSLAIGYPLQQCAANDPRLLGTVEFLLEACMVEGGFFQDMVHSGVNPYLTLHIAQVLLRSGDPRFLTLLERVAELATATGQWPEAIHPRTRGGCMGDGQHVWAAAEWLLMVRNCMVREEGGTLVIGSGIAPHWLADNTPITFGPAPTSFGTITLKFEQTSAGLDVSWDADWHTVPPTLDLRVPGFIAAPAAAGQCRASLQPEPSL